MSRLVINDELCTRCGLCVETCSERVLAQRTREDFPEPVQEALCIACGHCAAICPKGALRHTELPEGAVQPIRRDLLPGPEEVLELLRARRSVRCFTSRPLEPATVERILEAARCAPSAHNFQTTEYVVVRDETALHAITQLTAKYYAKVAKQIRNPIVRRLYRVALTRTEIESVRHLLPDFDMVVEAARRGEDPFLYEALCLIVAHAERSVNFPEANAILALHNATLMAQSLGVGGFLVGYVAGACQNDAAIPKLLGIARGHRVYGALALGYPRREFKNWIERRPLKVTWV